MSAGLPVAAKLKGRGSIAQTRRRQRHPRRRAEDIRASGRAYRGAGSVRAGGWMRNRQKHINRPCQLERLYPEWRYRRGG